MSKPPTQEGIEQLYLQHKKEATAAAHWAARRYYRPLTEAQDHADFALALLLLEHLDEHDPTRLTLGRWINMKIIWHLRTVYTSGTHPHVEDVREPRGRREWACSHMMRMWEEKNGPAAMEVKPSKIQQMFQEVGEEGGALLRILRDLPGDLWAEIRPTTGRTRWCKRTNLREWLVDTQDWSQMKTDQAFQEIEECL